VVISVSRPGLMPSAENAGRPAHRIAVIASGPCRMKVSVDSLCIGKPQLALFVPAPRQGD